MLETALEDVPPRYESQAVLEECHDYAIYGVAFNHFRKEENIFATVGGNRATIYRCQEDGTFQFLQSYLDEDETEEFYVCQWSVNETTEGPILMFAGKKGIVRVLDTRNNFLLKTLIGHGQAINDLAIFPTKPHLLLTASKDESARIWNIKTGITVCIVSGDGGHTAEVLSIDAHVDGVRFITSGMDDCIKLWTLKDGMDHVKQSDNWDPKKKLVNFPTLHLRYPLFSTNAVHCNYVDCIRFYGDLVISKGADERIVIFKLLELPEDPFTTSEKFTTLLEFPVAPCQVWYVRFGLDFEFSLLTCGDQDGRIHAWDLRDPTCIQQFLLTDKQCSTVIRQTAVSLDASIILGACDNGEVWRWDLKKTDSHPSGSASIPQTVPAEDSTD